MTEQPKQIHLVTEHAGVGTLLKVVAAYESEAKAEAHVALAKRLMPVAANKLCVTSMELADGLLSSGVAHE